MGNGATTSSHDMDLVVSLMMPVYYLPDNLVTSCDLCHLRESWQRIVTNQTIPYQRMQRLGTFRDDSCISWFYSAYFSRLFYVYPTSKTIFDENTQYQGKFLMRLVMTTIMCPSDNPHYRAAIKDLTTELCSKRFRPYELGVLGDVLFYALQTVLGDAYSSAVDLCWKKAFSHLLQIAVPLCVYNERHTSNTFRIHLTICDSPLLAFASECDSPK